MEINQEALDIVKTLAAESVCDAFAEALMEHFQENPDVFADEDPELWMKKISSEWEVLNENIQSAVDQEIKKSISNLDPDRFSATQQIDLWDDV